MARTRYGVSLWSQRFPATRRPAYPRYTGGDATADVVVVGAGLAGCLSAYFLARAGARVLVLEAGRVGQRAADSLGWIPEDPGVPFRTVQELYGLRATRRIFETVRKNALDAAALIKRLGIRCELERTDAWLLTAADTDAERWKREATLRSSAGLDSTWMPARRLSTDLHLDNAGAIRTKRDGVCDPYRACLGFAQHAIRAKAKFHERTPVRKITFNRKVAWLHTDNARIETRRIVIATGGAGPSRALRRHTRELDTYIVATPPLEKSVARAFGPPTSVIREAGAEPHTLRHTNDGRILIQGGDQAPVPARLREKALVQRTGQLMYELSRWYPAISGVIPEFGWSTSQVTSLDGLPVAGPHRNFPFHYFAIGLGLTGLTGAHLAARMIARHLEEALEPGDEELGFARFLVR